MPKKLILSHKFFKTPIGLALLIGIISGYGLCENLQPRWHQSENELSELNVCFTPGQNCELLITKALDKAKNKVLVQAYAFTSKPIADALIKCHQRGVTVKILYETQQSSKHSQISSLERSGIELVADKIKGVVHNKVIIIDEEYVITGSFNFTYAAQHMNAENVILIDNSNITKYYIDNWHSRYAKAKSL